MKLFDLKDGTQIYHTLTVMGVQGVLWLAWGFTGAWAGGLLGLGFFAGREVAQAEKRPADYPPEAEGKWWRGLYCWRWNLGSQQDLIYPAVATALTLGLAFMWGAL